MTIQTDHTTELARMQARRDEIIAERRALGSDPAAEARVWAIENELDNIDDRIGELGLSLDAVS